MDTKTSRGGESQNAEAVPPCISYDPTTPVLGAPLDLDVACYIVGERLNVACCKIALDLVGVFAGNARTPLLWSYTNGIPCTPVAAALGRLAAARVHEGAWKVFDPRVSALLPRVDAQLED